MSETKTRYSVEQLREIVTAGMAITEARLLLDEGYAVDDVLALAKLQAEQRTAAAAASQTATAKAMQKAMRPENETHPGISVFSYPEGDVARPKPVPAFEVLWNGYPCTKFLETQHWRECELLAQLKPGEFTVVRKDGSRMNVSVKDERNADGQITRLTVQFPISREDKWLVPPMAVTLYQLVHAGTKTPRQLFVEAMQEYLTQVVGEPQLA